MEPGEFYTESGSYACTTLNSSGCDSVATLNLTINSGSNSSEDVVACDSFLWNGETTIQKVEVTLLIHQIL